MSDRPWRKNSSYGWLRTKKRRRNDKEKQLLHNKRRIRSGDTTTGEDRKREILEREMENDEHHE